MEIELQIETWTDEVKDAIDALRSRRLTFAQAEAALGDIIEYATERQAELAQARSDRNAKCRAARAKERTT